MRMVSSLVVPGFVCLVLLYGLFQKKDVYQLFLEGAKEGIKTSVSIIPALVGIMTAIAMLRASGAIELLAGWMAPIFSFIGMPADVLPLAILRPVSGSASLGIVGEIFNKFGADSYQGRLASVMMGSTETTFYTVAVYFGVTRVKNLRHTLKSALIADFVSVVVSMIAVRLLLGG